MPYLCSKPFLEVCLFLNKEPAVWRGWASADNHLAVELQDHRIHTHAVRLEWKTLSFLLFPCRMTLPRFLSSVVTLLISSLPHSMLQPHGQIYCDQTHTRLPHSFSTCQRLLRLPDLEDLIHFSPFPSVESILQNEVKHCCSHESFEVKSFSLLLPCFSAAWVCWYCFVISVCILREVQPCLF